MKRTTLVVLMTLTAVSGIAAVVLLPMAAQARAKNYQEPPSVSSIDAKGVGGSAETEATCGSEF